MKHKIFSLLVALIFLIGIDVFAGVQPIKNNFSSTFVERVNERKTIQDKQEEKAPVKIERVEVIEENDCVVIIIERTRTIWVLYEDFIIGVEVVEVTIIVIC